MVNKRALIHAYLMSKLPYDNRKYATSLPLKLEFDVDLTNLLPFVKKKVPAKFNEFKKNSEKKYNLSRRHIAELFQQKFPEIELTDSNEQKQWLIDDDMATQIQNDLPSFFRSKRIDINAECTYQDAHAVAAHILEISKINGRSEIQPKIKFDETNGKFYVEIQNSQIPDLRLSVYSGAEAEKTNRITRMIAELIAILRGEKLLSTLKHSFLDTIPDTPISSLHQYNDLTFTTSDGVPLEGIEIYEKGNENNNAYIIQCHGNASHYRQFLSRMEKTATLTHCKVVGFDYRGYGLSPGEVLHQKDMYEDAFAVAKHCVDQGATYILLEGTSVGGAPAAVTANRLRAYCKAQNKDVQIEHMNVISFSSTPKMVAGLLLESDGKNRKPQGFFRKVINFLLTPLVKLVLRKTDWDMNPKQELAKMPSNHYEVISASGDTVIGTHASMEYALRKQNAEEIAKLNAELSDMQSLMLSLKHEIAKLIKHALPNMSFSKYSFENYTAKQLQRLFSDWVPESAELEAKLLQLKKLEVQQRATQLNIKLKETRLMHTPDTAACTDGYAEATSNSHGYVSMLACDAISIDEKELAFVNARELRHKPLPDDINELSRLNKIAKQSLKLFKPIAQPSPVTKPQLHLPYRINSLESYYLEIDRLYQTLIGNVFVNVRNTLQQLRQLDIEADECLPLIRSLPEDNKIVANFKKQANSFVQLAMAEAPKLRRA